MSNFKIKYKPIHPGDILKTEFLDELNISEVDLAKKLNIDQEIIQEICKGKRNISDEIASKLAQFFNISVEFWINLQKQYNSKATEFNKN